MSFFNLFKNIFKKEPQVVPIKIEPIMQPIVPTPTVIQPKPSIITEVNIQKILNNPNSDEWFLLFKKYFSDYEINSTIRISAFLAQTCHESLNYKTLEENLNYSGVRLLAVFPKYFKGVDITKYTRNKKAIANRVYANRMGNGSEASGDGYKFRGRGVIQITGKYNYTKLASFLNKTIDETVNFLSTKEGALVSALWFWKTNNLNTIADSENHQLLCKKINGGLNGLSDRIAKYNKFKAILS